MGPRRIDKDLVRPHPRGWERLTTELRTVRNRTLLTTLGFMIVTLGVVGGLTHYLQLVEVGVQIEQDVQQEAEELARFASRGPVSDPQGVAPVGTGPGEAFTDLNTLFYAFMASTVPGQGEDVFAVVDGSVYGHPQSETEFSINDQDLVDAVRSRAQPDATVLFDHVHEGHSLRLGVVTVTVAGDDRTGMLVVGTDLQGRREAVFASLRQYAMVSVAMVLLAGIAAYVSVGRLTAPITRLRQATQEISPEDLGHRVEVPEEDSDVAQLARNVNTMLDRIEEGFTVQRQFLDDAAHELRTPLTILHGNLELMNEADPEDVEETRGILMDEIDRMYRLVEDLLLLAKLQRPDFVRPEPISVEDFTHEAMDKIRTLGDRQWRLEATAGGQVRADRQRLTQAVVQLAANAVKFSDPGTPIALGAAWALPPEGFRPESGPTASWPWLSLWVRDAGIGISDEDRDRIFERFARAETGRTVEGSGLGLSIVLGIVEGHGGTVTVEPNDGPGSTFTLWIPPNGHRRPDLSPQTP